MDQNINTQSNLSNESSPSIKMGVLGAVVIVGIAGYYYFASNRNQVEVKDVANIEVSVATTTESSMTSSSSPSTSTTTEVVAKYKDGVYKETGVYTAPSGKEIVTVTVSLAGGNIVDATFVGKPTSTASEKYQKAFSDGFKSKVVGKSIDDVNLTVVNGSSLTPIGFMDAISKVKKEASIN